MYTTRHLNSIPSGHIRNVYLCAEQSLFLLVQSTLLLSLPLPDRHQYQVQCPRFRAQQLKGPWANNAGLPCDILRSICTRDVTGWCQVPYIHVFLGFRFARRTLSLFCFVLSNIIFGFFSCAFSWSTIKMVAGDFLDSLKWICKIK